MPVKEASGADSAINSTYATMEEIEAAVRISPKLRQEYANLGMEGFLQKYLVPKTEGDEAGKNEPPVEEPAAEAKDETPERDRIVQELEETTINPMQKRLAEMDEENRKLKIELENKKRVEEEQSKVALPDEINLDDFQGDDIFDEAKQKKLVGVVKSLATKYSALQKKQIEIDGKVKTQVELDAEERQNASRRQSIEDEQAEIERVRKSNPDLFKNKRDIKAVESEYIALMRDLGRLKGYQGPVIDLKTGMFVKEVNDAYMEFHDEKSELRKQAEARRLKMPDDFDDLLLLHKLREIRNDNFKRDKATGTLRPVSYSEALDTYISRQPAQEDPKIKLARDKKEAEARAIQNREHFAKELPASGGANPLDLTAINDRDFAVRLSTWKKSGKEEDRAWLENVMRMLNMPQGEIDQTLKRK